ncbi:MAG: T9SS type A sorting domain-containing protein, partial [Bacteroidota bacterium]
KILLITFGALSILAKAQITLEHTYDTASMVSSAGFYNDQLMIINFESDGERYVKVSRTNKSISIYDMNHSFLKKISFAGLPYYNYNSTALLYFSEHLFNDDDNIEFMYASQGLGFVYTGIYNEDGILIFSDTGAAVIMVNYEQQQLPIYNTSVGTKMILSYRGGIAKVFSLPGTLSDGIQESNAQLMQVQVGQFSNLYPNPSNGAVTLQYELPEGETEGELILYDLQGTEVKRYTVDNTFKDVLIDNTQLPAGTYLYQLQTSKGAVGTKKMVVIK